jgi:hypothetical protein
MLVGHPQFQILDILSYIHLYRLSPRLCWLQCMKIQALTPFADLQLDLHFWSGRNQPRRNAI